MAAPKMAAPGMTALKIAAPKMAAIYVFPLVLIYSKEKK